MKNIFSLAAVALSSAMFFACSTDNDSNPTLVEPSEFTVHTPEFAGQTVVLQSTPELTMTWNQPMLTDKGAYIGSNGTAGISYEIQVSQDGKFSTEYDASKINEDGVYEGSYDFITLDDVITETNAKLQTTSINRALNMLQKQNSVAWEEDQAIAVQKAYIRVNAVVASAAGAKYASIPSNVVALTVLPYWVDLNKGGAAAYMWVPGNGNGWNHGAAPVLVSEGNDGIYVGYAYMDGDFKFTMVPEWGEERNNGNFKSASDCIDLGDQGGGNISYTGTPGLCYIVVDDNENTLSVTPCTWGVVGNFNGWSVAAGEIVEMAYNKDAHCLEAKVTFDADAEWKFARDNSWDINLGGKLDALTQGGDNITTPAGEYTIQLFIERAIDGNYAKVK